MTQTLLPHPTSNHTPQAHHHHPSSSHPPSIIYQIKTVGRQLCILTVSGDNDGDNQSVDTQDTRHDHRNDISHHQTRVHYTH